MSEPYDLQRFVVAQDVIWPAPLSELRAGRKTSHWMWFVFPQIKGLGASPTSVRYAITSLDEARAYIAHPLLGPRLLECCDILLSLDGFSADQIFGYPDTMKLRSSLTLFVEAAPHEERFQQLLQKYYDGDADPQSLALIEKDGP